MTATAEFQHEGGWWSSWYPAPPETTRDRILFAAFREAHLNGFQAASIQRMIDSAGVTKGALYHYFSSKNEIGYALLDDLFSRYIEYTFVAPLQETDDPITTLVDYLLETGGQMSEEDIALGCPLDHFAQEMAPVNREFQQRIDALYQKKQEVLVAAFRRGQMAGNVTRATPAESIALMVTATMQGCMAMAKNSRSLEKLMQCGEGLIHYLQQLRPSEADAKQ